MSHRGFVVLAGWVVGVGLQLQQAALSSPWAYASLLLVGVLGLVGLHRVRSAGSAGTAVVLALALLAGASIGGGLTGLRATHFAASALDPALQGIDIEVTGRIASLPQRSAQGERFELVVESASRAGEAVRLPERLQLSWYGSPPAAAEGSEWAATTASPGLRAGERWRLTVRLRSPHGNANPHGFDRERWLWEQGIQATGYVRSGPREPAPKRLGATLSHPLDTLRQTVSERIGERVADPRSAGVLAALVVGDQSAIVGCDKRVLRSILPMNSTS